jgi:hypothetical protein
VTLSITSPTGNQIESRTTDLMSLAIRAGQLRAGASPLTATPASQPAFTIDPRTKALADALDEAQQKTVSIGPDEPTQAERLAGLEDRRLVAEESEQGVERYRKQIKNINEIVKRWDETGQMWETDKFSELIPSPPGKEFLKNGGNERYIELLREASSRMPQGLIMQINSAKAWREGYEISRRDILEGR